MKKNILIGILATTSVLSLLFAYQQRQLANEAVKQALESKATADKLIEMSQIQEELAEATYLKAKRELDSLELIARQKE